MPACSAGSDRPLDRASHGDIARRNIGDHFGIASDDDVGRCLDAATLDHTIQPYAAIAAQVATEAGSGSQDDLDLIWFGIYLVVVVEMSQITPPVGFNLFVIQGLTGRDILYVARCALPFFFLLVAAVAILIAVPEIATQLPEWMNEAASK